MRCAGIAAWTLLLLLVAIPALRHASVIEFAGSRQVSIQPAPRCAPAIARIAAITAVGIETPTPVAVALALPAPPPSSPAPPDPAPLVPLRL